MTQDVRLAHGLTGVFLIAFAIFAVLLLVLGALLLVFADRLAAAGQGSVLGFRVAGGVGLAMALLMLRGALRDVSAVARIRVDARDRWTLCTRFGRTVAVLGPDTPRAFELEGRRLYLLSAAVPKRQDLVFGRLVVPERPEGYRLATSGPFAYDRALEQLGYDERAPRPGERASV